MIKLTGLLCDYFPGITAFSKLERGAKSGEKIGGSWARESERTPMGKLSKMSFRPLADRLQGPST